MHLFGKLYHLAGNNGNTTRSLVKSNSFIKTSKIKSKLIFRLQAAKGNTTIKFINVNDITNICQSHLLFLEIIQCHFSTL